MSVVRGWHASHGEIAIKLQRRVRRFLRAAAAPLPQARCAFLSVAMVFLASAQHGKLLPFPKSCSLEA
jgi:hypothetical protein